MIQTDDNGENYSTIRGLYTFMGIIPLIILPFFNLLSGWSILALKRIVWKYTEHNKRYKILLSQSNYCEFFTKVLVFCGILYTYIIAMIKLHEYCIETFNSGTITFLHVIIFVIVTIIVIPCTIKFNDIDNDGVDDDHGDNHNHDDDDEENRCDYQCILKYCNCFTTVMISTCLGYFFPYMIIALILNPLQSGFIYVTIFVFVVLLSLLEIHWLIFHASVTESFTRKCLLFSTFFFTVFAVQFILMLLIALFTLGSFSDFDDLKNIILPLFTSLIASLVGIGIFYIKKQIGNSTSSYTEIQ